MIIGFGEILWDIYPDEKRIGGAPANVILHLHRLGMKSMLISGIGEDELGRELINTLCQFGIETDTIQRNHKRTGTVHITLDSEGNPQFICSKNVAFDYIQWNDKLEKMAEVARVVLFGTLVQRNRISQRTLHQFLERTDHAIRLFDVNFRGCNRSIQKTVEHTLPKTDILKINENELMQLKRAYGQEENDDVDFLKYLIDCYPLKVIALSLGQRGCWLMNGERIVHSKGIKIEPIDTTGCGDAFVAGLIYKYIHKKPLQEICNFANQMGGFVATRKGAFPEYSVDDLEKFIKGHDESCSLSV